MVRPDPLRDCLRCFFVFPRAPDSVILTDTLANPIPTASLVKPSKETMLQRNALESAQLHFRRSLRRVFDRRLRVEHSRTPCPGACNIPEDQSFCLTDKELLRVYDACAG